MKTVKTKVITITEPRGRFACHLMHHGSSKHKKAIVLR
ncbi:hypothetical protein FTV88_1903 [Heliorestis convoluta]|uniref:Uncharacterized protein n=1 Tax=Heliorestis convoluta TaxID=356322 RepID=A0A5Q2N0Y7_9FIRM|nr:hypothetical protein FTV88_1903 [Heliorestis convoluta]